MKALSLGFGLAAAATYLALDFSKWMRAGMHRKPRAECIREDKSIRENLSEKQIDKGLQDSFPASDPATYY